MKIFIGMPVRHLIERKTLDCINTLQNNGFEFSGLCAEKGSNLPIARNGLVRRAIASGADYFLGIDSDITFSIEDFVKLYEMEKDIVFGAFRSKMQRDRFEAGYYHEGYPGCGNDKIHASVKGILEVDWAGTGFFLARVKFLEEIKSPWFRQPDVLLPDGTMDICGEDVGFCLKLNLLNVPVLLNCDIELGHIIRDDELRFSRRVA